jgi:hypothetical protein
MTPQEAGGLSYHSLIKNLGSEEAARKDMSRRGRLGGRPTWQEALNKELRAHGKDKEGLQALPAMRS